MKSKSMTWRNNSNKKQSNSIKSINPADINSEITTIEIAKDAKEFVSLYVGLSKGAIRVYSTNPL